MNMELTWKKLLGEGLSNQQIETILLFGVVPIILLTIANSDGVHILTRFFRESRKKNDVKEAVGTTLNALFLPIFLTSFTTSIAFLAFVFSPIEQFIGYGISLAFGIMWAWILSTTLLPSIILIKKWNLESKFIKKESVLEVS